MTFDKNTRIAVLLGGLSKERDVSLRTGRAMANGLRAKGYKNVTEIDVGADVSSVLEKGRPQVAMIALHGRYGEDGTIQGILEYLKIPYTGTGVLASAIAMNKVVSKKLFEMNGVFTPPWVVATAKTDLKELREKVESKLGFPVIAKPSNEGSTIGLSVVKNGAEIEAAQRTALQFDSEVLWEKYIQGTELTVGFLANRPLPIVEIVPKKGIFDYEAKYTKGMTDYFCPARISESFVKIVQKESEKAFRALECDSFGRVDLMLEGDKPWVLEVNTIPGMTETSLLPKAAKAAGITFEEMMETILQDARLKG